MGKWLGINAEAACFQYFSVLKLLVFVNMTSIVSNYQADLVTVLTWNENRKIGLGIVGK